MMSSCEKKKSEGTAEAFRAYQGIISITCIKNDNVFVSFHIELLF